MGASPISRQIMSSQPPPSRAFLEMAMQRFKIVFPAIFKNYLENSQRFTDLIARRVARDSWISFELNESEKKITITWQTNTILDNY